MSVTWPLGPSWTGSSGPREAACGINQPSAATAIAAIRPSTSSQAAHRSMGYALAVLLLLLSTTVDVLVLAQDSDSRPGEDYYAAAVREIVDKCINRCPDQVLPGFFWDLLAGPAVASWCDPF
uniref:Uncharacterized protein n=1 Tax=Anopheles atroparvus TaxID=41427 RepID=A0A182J1U1_ANOAO